MLRRPKSGVSRFVTNEVTNAPNAAPITMPTARSTTLPRRMNFRKPSMSCLPVDADVHGI
jgi:hypothetical protein